MYRIYRSLTGMDVLLEEKPLFRLGSRQADSAKTKNTMANMIPAKEYTKFPETDHGAEEIAFDAFEQYLPGEYIVYHSFDWYQSENRSYEDRIEGEIDFLICDPDGRLLIIEVKSGTIGYHSETDQWFRRIHENKRKPIETNPLEQTESARKRLVEALKQNPNIGPKGRCPGLVGTALCFPGMNRDEAVQINDISLPKNQLLFFDDLEEEVLEDRIEQQYTRTRNELPFDPDGLSDREVDTMKEQVLPNTFDIPRSLRNRLNTSSRAVHQLTEKQKQFLSFLNGAKEAYIKGYAGSGKTFLSIEQANRLSDEESEVLWLCYNKILSRKLPTRYDTDDIEISHYHEFANLFCREHGVNLFDHHDDEDPDFWQRTVPELFLDTAEEADRTYDAIILDEAQDFLGSYVIGLRELLSEDGRFYAFYDPRQNVYHEQLPEWLVEHDEEAMLLPNNVRNTEEISRTSAVLGDFEYDEHVKHLGPSGQPVRVSTVDDRRDVREQLRKAFHEVFNEENISTERAVVLGYRRFKNTVLGDDPDFGNFTLVDMKDRYDERAPDGQDGDAVPVPLDRMEVAYYTIHSYKGLDRDIVFLVNPEAGEKHVLDYAGASRARHLLWIMTEDPNIERNIRKQAPDSIETE